MPPVIWEAIVALVRILAIVSASNGFRLRRYAAKEMPTIISTETAVNTAELKKADWMGLGENMLLSRLKPCPDTTLFSESIDPFTLSILDLAFMPVSAFSLSSPILFKASFSWARLVCSDSTLSVHDGPFLDA